MACTVKWVKGVHGWDAHSVRTGRVRRDQTKHNSINFGSKRKPTAAMKRLARNQLCGR